MTASHRPAALAGRFYPASAATLRAQLQTYLADARSGADRLAAAPKLIVVPHAGYVYSAPIAARAYARIARWRERYRRVVLLGPTHRVAVRGLAAPTVAAFDTPLGPVPIDAAALARVDALPQLVRSDAVHADEHALEVQLPFLQAVLGRFTLVPLAVGHTDAQAVAQVLEQLWGGDETLVVISTDLSHYLGYGQARITDAQTVRQIQQLEPTLSHEQACGATPLNGALLVAQRRKLVPELLDLRNSGDTAGDRRRVVGYAALVFTAAPGSAAVEDDDETAAARAGDRIGDGGSAAAAEGAAAAAEREPGGALGPALLARAHNAIAQALGQRCVAEPAHPALWQPGATFVTLQRDGRLRGCIGRLQAERVLDEDVRANARGAAFHDRRFAPLAAAEWAGLSVEVSLLTPLQPLPVRDEADALAQLRPGVDGVVLSYGERRATFLPQVWAQLPQPGAFLRELKRKAGLDAGFWHAQLRVERYRVRKFGPQARA